jgi:hypothetical protein
MPLHQSLETGKRKRANVVGLQLDRLGISKRCEISQSCSLGDFWPIAAGCEQRGWYHACHDRPVPKLSQRLLLTPKEPQ